MNNRNRALLDLAHALETCPGCGLWNNGLEPAHENGIESGKGFGIKGHDNRHAALCHECHAWYDQGPAPKEQKGAFFERAHKATFDEYFKRGWIAVTPAGKKAIKERKAA